MKKLSLALALVMLFSTFASPLAIADVEGDAQVYSEEGSQSVEVAIENGTIEGQIVTGEDPAVIINQDIDGSICAYNGINLVINGQVISPIGMAAVYVDGEGILSSMATLRIRVPIFLPMDWMHLAAVMQR